MESKTFFDRACSSYMARATWTKLHVTGSSPIARISVFMPVFGYLILLNSEFLHYADLDPRFKLFANSTPWRLLLLYYGSVSLGIATLLFSIRKSPLAHHKAPYDFYNETKDFLGNRTNLEKIIGSIRNAMETDRTGTTEFVQWANIGDIVERSTPERIAIADPVPVLLVTWQVENVKRPISRLACRLLFDLSFVLIGIPSAITLIGVIRFTISRTLDLL